MDQKKTRKRKKSVLLILKNTLNAGTRTSSIYVTLSVTLILQNLKLCFIVYPYSFMNYKIN